MGTITPAHDFVSIGQLAAHTQRSVRAIEAAADALKLAPALRLNGIPHFNGEQVERLTEQLNTEQQK